MVYSAALKLKLWNKLIIKEVDFDFYLEYLVFFYKEAPLYLEMKKMFGTKKRTIHNIPDYNIDRILNAIPNKLKYYIKIKDMFVVLKVMLLKVKCFKLKKGNLRVSL